MKIKLYRAFWYLDYTWGKGKYVLTSCMLQHKNIESAIMDGKKTREEYLKQYEGWRVVDSWINSEEYSFDEYMDILCEEAKWRIGVIIQGAKYPHYNIKNNV